MCRDFLQKGKCPSGESCDLSHEPVPERVPACVHFLRGTCTADPCRYTHVHVNPAAPVCRAFAMLGYCSKGIDCAEKHVHECPDWSNHGTCRNKRCRLPHVDRAGQLRKRKENNTEEGGEENEEEEDLDSDEEPVDEDDVDSDDMTEVLVPDQQSHEVSQQVDYIGFK